MRNFECKVDVLEDAALGTEGRILVEGNSNLRILEQSMVHPESKAKRSFEMATKTELVELRREHSRRNFRVGITGAVDEGEATSGRLLGKRRYLPAGIRQASFCA